LSEIVTHYILGSLFPLVFFFCVLNSGFLWVPKLVIFYLLYILIFEKKKERIVRKTKGERLHFSWQKGGITGKIGKFQLAMIRRLE
jgi:hypothetical protein